jgi:hypothetical protein
MTEPPAEEQRTPVVPNERTALLQPHDDEDLEGRAPNGSQQRDDDTDTPIAEEPSTRKLIILMGSIWVGVFCNAIGMCYATSVILHNKAGLCCYDKTSFVRFG